MARRGRRATTPTPSHAPSTAAAIRLISVVRSTVTAVMKISAWMTVGVAWPALSVPGICSSGGWRRSLKIAVVGAKDPMPSVSKKFVTNPIAPSVSPGSDDGAAGSRVRARSSRYQRAMYHKVSAPSAHSRASVPIFIFTNASIAVPRGYQLTRRKNPMAEAGEPTLGRREFVQGAVSTTALAAAPGFVLAASRAAAEKAAVLAQIPKMHAQNVKRLQDWMALPSMAA